MHVRAPERACMRACLGVGACLSVRACACVGFKARLQTKGLREREERAAAATEELRGGCGGSEAASNSLGLDSNALNLHADVRWQAGNLDRGARRPAGPKALREKKHACVSIVVCYETEVGQQARPARGCPARDAGCDDTLE